MKIILDLSGKNPTLVFSDISHSQALDIIDNTMTDYNERLADKSNKLRYRYIPGPLTIFGTQVWLRLFCELNDMPFEVKYSFPPMPIG